MQAKAGYSREDVFRDLPIPTALRKMIVPAIASQLIVLIYNMAAVSYTHLSTIFRRKNSKLPGRGILQISKSMI